MAQDTVVGVFVIIAAVALVAQAALMLGMYFGLRRVQQHVEAIRADIKQRFDPLAQSVAEIVAGSREPILSIASNLAEITRILRERAGRVDELAGDFVEKMRLHVAHVDQMLSAALDRVENTAELVHRNVLVPIQEISAVIKGVKAGLDYFFARRGAPSATEVTQDEQMFI